MHEGLIKANIALSLSWKLYESLCGALIAALIFKHSFFQVLSYHASAQQSEVNKIMVTTQFVLKKNTSYNSVVVFFTWKN